MDNNENVLVQCSIIEERVKSIRIRVNGAPMWIPTSQIVKQEIRDDNFFITIPSWLAQKKGLVDV